MARRSKLRNVVDLSRVVLLGQPFLLLLALVMVGLCSTADKLKAQNIQTYPEWFLETPNTGHLYAVGYSPVQYYDSSTLQRALIDLQDRLSANRGLRIHLEMLWEKLPDDSFTVRGLSIETDTLYNTLTEPATLGSAVSGSMQIIFGSTVTGAPFPQPVFVKPGKKPEWVTTLPKSDRFWLAIGTSPIGVTEEMSWQRAEQQALYELAQNKSVTIQMVERKFDNASESVIHIETDVILRNIQVVARWRDEFNCYVLIKAE